MECPLLNIFDYLKQNSTPQDGEKSTPSKFEEDGSKKQEAEKRTVDKVRSSTEPSDTAVTL